MRDVRTTYNSFLRVLLLIPIIFGLATFTVNGQTHTHDGSTHTHQDLAKQSANPIGNLISLPLQFNFNQGLGEFDRSQFVLNIEPVLPIELNSSVTMINRIIIPIINQPDVSSDSGSTFGIGNTNYTAFFTPAHPGAIIWGLGPTFTIPTISSTDLGGTDFGIGPSLVVLGMPGHFVLGFLVSNTWSYLTSDIDMFMFQYFITLNFKGGWYINTTPVMTANWNADEGEQWTIPVGAGGGLVTHIGSQHIKFQLQAYSYVAKPTNGPDWLMQFTVMLLFPKG